jgi:hypothetical protein
VLKVIALLGSFIFMSAAQAQMGPVSARLISRPMPSKAPSGVQTFSAEARPIVEYTWGKIWNAKAYNACSNMPRSGHMGNLSEQQIKHIMALLLDPASPVNK